MLNLVREHECVVLGDEARHPRNEVLEDLRLPTSYQMDSENRFASGHEQEVLSCDGILDAFPVA